MPRPLFGQNNKLKDSWKNKTETRFSGGVHIEQRLRQTRSSHYVENCQQLDVDEKVLSDQKLNEILESIDHEFADVAKEDQPVGIVAACHLGAPFEVHTLDLLEEIIIHYKMSQPLPDQLEKARTLATHPHYAFVEVYLNAIRMIDKEGGVSVIRDPESK